MNVLHEHNLFHLQPLLAKSIIHFLSQLAWFLSKFYASSRANVVSIHGICCTTLIVN